MNIKKLPLAERIQRRNTGHPGHEEYYYSLIRDIAHTPLSAYMDSFYVNYEVLRKRLSLEGVEPDNLTYAQTTAYIASWYKSDSTRADALEAMKLLAAPLFAAQKLYQKPRKEVEL